MLLTSLFALDRKEVTERGEGGGRKETNAPMYPSQECVECSVHALTELLLHYKLGNERWLDALTDTFTHLDKSGHMTIT